MKPVQRLEDATGHRASVLLYASCVGIAGVVAWAALVLWAGLPDLLAVGFFWALHLVAHAAAVEVPVGRLSIAQDGAPRPVVISGGALLLMTAVFATSPSTAATVALLPVFHLRRPTHKEDLVRKLFNTGQEVIYASAAASIFFTVPGPERSFGALILGAALAMVAAVALNALLVAGVISLERGWNPLLAVQLLLWPLMEAFIFGSVAFVVALLYRDAGPLAALFILTPLFVVAQANRAKVAFDEAQEKTLRSFVRAIELKDPYTSRHSERVAEIAVQIHRRLGAREDYIRRRFYGALMHDLGKVAIPGRVLSKPGKLDEREWVSMQRHPELGAQVAREVSVFADLAPEIIAHHERIDGRGYPKGLSGDEIPMEARVLSVADAFEALTSDRPYRAAMTEAEALKELQRCTGTQLDSTSVEALERLLEEGYTFPQLGRHSIVVPAVDDLRRAPRGA